jgi:RimJ/RimL family protein N-acetyltransferase
VPWIVEGCNDPAFVRFTIDVPHPYTADDARRFIDLCARAWDERRRAPFAIAEAATGAGLGLIDLHLFRDDATLASVGYWVGPHARGRGAATRALRLVASWAFAELGIERLQLTTHPDNVASQRVAERAGFTREGLLRSYLAIPRGRRDSLMYSLLPGDLEG